MVIIGLSRYILAMLIALYAFHCFMAFGYGNEKERSGFYIFQRVFLIGIHLISYVVLSYRMENEGLLLFCALQEVFFFGIILLCRVLYPEANRLVINNMCLLLMVGFVMLTRLSMDKALRQFFIAAVSVFISLVIPHFIMKKRTMTALTWVFGIVGIAALLSVMAAGAVINGSRISYTIAGVTFQPSEFVKLLFIFFVAGILSRGSTEKELNTGRGRKKRRKPSFAGTESRRNALQAGKSKRSLSQAGRENWQDVTQGSMKKSNSSPAGIESRWNAPHGSTGIRNLSRVGEEYWTEDEDFNFEADIPLQGSAEYASGAPSLSAVSISAVIAAIHVIILVLSRDLGTALIFFVIYVLMLFTASRNYLTLLIGAVAAALGTLTGYRLFSHVRTRFLAWRDPFSYIEGQGYQITQSLFAIGTGGWFGMGLCQGSPEKIPVVEQDFIFSAISEEFGCIFSFCIILVCISTFLMFMNIAMSISDPYYRLVALGLAISYAFQVFLTIGGATKFIPLTGVTLPLVSYGGSSVLSTCLMFFVVQGIYILRNREVSAKGAGL